MAIDPTTTTTSGASYTGSGTSAGKASLNQTFDSFLMLLTTQLRYQDPTSPMDTNEFTSQLVQYSEVEQSIKQNDNLEQLIALQGANQIAFATSLTGKDVEYEGNALPYASGDTLTYNYELPTDSVMTKINIINEDGNVVYSAPGKLGAGKHSFEWDGKLTDGTEAPEGTYRIQVQAVDAEGGSITAIRSVTQKVVGVEFIDGDIVLDLGVGKVSLANVMAVREHTPRSAA